LQAAADGFEAHVRCLCATLGVPLRVAHVDARAKPGQSPEDAARVSRYAALAEMAGDLQVVLLGQHLDDQAETVLLALSRGAGLRGLAAMPDSFERHGVRFGRPLLTVPALALRQSLQDRGLGWVDDPTNTDLRYTRNRLRQRLLPLWLELFPHGAQALARTASHAAQAQGLLDDLARIDLDAVGQPPGLRALQVLSRERQGNAIRYWLRQSHGVLPSAVQLEELLDQVQACRTRGHGIRLKVGPGLVSRDGERLQYTPSV
jgi:tRNA(Ile)-lysidine synthase